VDSRSFDLDQAAVREDGRRKEATERDRLLPSSLRGERLHPQLPAIFEIEDHRLTARPEPDGLRGARKRHPQPAFDQTAKSLLGSSGTISCGSPSPAVGAHPREIDIAAARSETKPPRGWVDPPPAPCDATVTLLAGLGDRALQRRSDAVLELAVVFGLVVVTA
jgi:hypothetical protein